MSGQRGVLAGLMAVWLLSFSSVVAAANNGDTTTVTVSGTLLEPQPECTLGGNNHVHVDFGDEIITHQINTGGYIEEIPHELTCNNLAHQKLKLIFKGTPASFDNRYFSTSNPAVGFMILAAASGAGYKELSPDGEFTFTYGEPLDIIAGLWSDYTNIPLAGYFTAAITVVIAYQ